MINLVVNAIDMLENNNPLVNPEFGDYLVGISWNGFYNS